MTTTNEQVRDAGPQASESSSGQERSPSEGISNGASSSAAAQGRASGQNQPRRGQLRREGGGALKRLLLRFSILLLIWAVSNYLRTGSLWGAKKKPQVIYASRYSDEFKYRPAASPVITETLKDGRIRIRGANPVGVGIHPTDLPKTPKQLEQEALEAAKDKLGMKDRASKSKGKGKKGKTMGEKIIERQRTKGKMSVADTYKRGRDEI